MRTSSPREGEQNGALSAGASGGGWNLVDTKWLSDDGARDALNGHVRVVRQTPLCYKIKLYKYLGAWWSLSREAEEEVSKICTVKQKKFKKKFKPTTLFFPALERSVDHTVGPNTVTTVFLVWKFCFRQKVERNGPICLCYQCCAVFRIIIA